MKKILALITAILLALLSSCSNKTNSSSEDASTQSTTRETFSTITTAEKELTTESSKVDIDLTKLSSTMVYSEVYNMMSKPENYIGKKIKMKGMFSYFKVPETNNEYFSCIISDATACCSQGIEFVLDDNRSYPDEYPKVGSEITVVGTFETYKEFDVMYCRLANAKLIE